MESIKLQVSAEKLVPNLKFAFSNRTTFIKELLQNCDRAQATRIDVTVDHDRITIEDNGVGIANMADLLHVAESGWSESVKANCHPFGIGWLSALFAAEHVEVVSGRAKFSAQTEDILSYGTIPVQAISSPEEDVSGTRITLSGFTHSHHEIITAVKRLCVGFPRRVFLNTVEVDRPHATDSARRFHSSAVGLMSVPSLLGNRQSHGDYICYLQGFPIFETIGLQTFRCNVSDVTVIHLDARRFMARLPDRDVLVDQDLQIKEVKQVYEDLWRAHLKEELETLGPVAFLDQYATVARTYMPAIFNLIPYVPRTWLSRITDVPFQRLSSNEDGLEEIQSHMSREDIESGNTVIVALQHPDPDTEDLLSWAYAAGIGAYQLTEHLPSGHWLEEWVEDDLEWKIEVRADVIKSADVALNHTYIAGPIFLVENYVLARTDVADAPSVAVSDFSIWSGEAFWVPVADPYPDCLLPKINDFTDEWDRYHEEWESEDMTLFGRVVTDLKYPQPEALLKTLLEEARWNDYPSLTGGKISFVVTFDGKTASVEKTPAL